MGCPERDEIRWATTVLFIAYLLCACAFPAISAEKTTDPPELVEEVCKALGELYYHADRISSDCKSYSYVSEMVSLAGDDEVIFDSMRTEDGRRKTIGMTCNIPKSGKITGIGISFKKEHGWPEVKMVIKGSPASLAGIQVGDVILQVDGKITARAEMEEIISWIRGKPGTEVELMIKREKETIKFRLKREVISLFTAKKPPVSRSITADTAYINVEYYWRKKGDFSDFKEDFLSDVKAYVDKGSKRVILDLRTGLPLEEAFYVAGLFLPADFIIAYRKSRQGTETFRPESGNTPFSVEKMVVLIDGKTCFGAEFLSEALRERLGYVLIGENTGKCGIDRAIYYVRTQPYTDYFINYVSGEYLTCQNRPLNEIAVSPDIVVVNAVTGAENDVALEKAIEYLNKDAL